MLFFILTLPSLVHSLQCLDEAGGEVDWWIVYKLPKRQDKSRYEPDSRESFLSEGLAYVYITSDAASKEWRLSSLSVGDPASVPGRTLAPLYAQDNKMQKRRNKWQKRRKNKKEELFHLMWNDEHPHGPTSFTKGHTKGLVVGDPHSSVWLIHSVPHYPPFPNESYAYPHTGQKYGQTAMCITISTPSIDTVGTQLKYNNPYIYAKNTPKWMDKYQNFISASHGKHIKNAPFFNIEGIQSKAGTNFTTFAKYTSFGKDLYADLVAPALQVPLLVESWPNGPGKMPSRCSGPFIVENINEMDFEEVENDDFTTRHDHAKWAMSLDYKRPYVCVGDINRMETQRKRGGGTACFINKDVWRTFKTSVKAIEDCGRG